MCERYKKLDFSTASQCFTPKVSNLKRKNSDWSPISTKSIKHERKKTALTHSVTSLVEGRPKKCCKKVDFLEVSNKNVKTDIENCRLRGAIKEAEAKIISLEVKLEKAYEQVRIKDEMINKLSSFILTRENQFIEVIKKETEELNKKISENHAELTKYKQIHSTKFSTKSIQVTIDPVYEDIYKDKSDEILRLQNKINKNKYHFKQEKAFLQEQIDLLEQELKKAEKIFADQEATYLNHIKPKNT